ncbi:MAG: oligosaccharide flippase family protein, partial [Proteobacteria bacterium]|nr:oligosaccharide flippase family protein [Pseudomonadota bacterium]
MTAGSPPPRRGDAVFWSAAEAGAAGLLSFVSAFLVAHLVGPGELGIGAAVVAPQVLLWIGVNALFADALAQRPAVDEDTASSAFWASLGVGCLAALAQAGCGLALSRAMDDPRLAAMGAALALPLPLVGAAGAAQGILTRRRDYRTLASRTILGQGLGSLVGVGLALAGAGAWAVVAQQAAGSFAGASVLLLRAGWRPRPRCSPTLVRGLLAVGGPLVAGTLVQHGRYRLFALAIGDVAGPVALGEVHLAFRLVDTLRDLTATALWRLMLPSFAERQHDRAALFGALDRCLGLSGLAMFPLWGALALAAGPLIALLLGPAWAGAARAALPLAAVACWTSLGFPAGVAAVARGATRYTLAANLAMTALTLGGVWLLRPETPRAAALIWVAAQLALAPYVVAMAARALRFRPLRTLRAGLPPLALAGAATAVAAAASAL